MTTDIERLRAGVSLSDTALRMGVNLQQDGTEWEACCPFHEESTPSFTVFPGKDGIERYHCFGCLAGGDVLDFVQAIKGVNLPEAISILGGTSDRANIVPARIANARDIYAGIEPIDPPGELKAGRRVKLWNPKRGKFGTVTPTMVFPYRRADGSLIGYVLRNDFTDRDTGKAKKETPMVRFARLPDGTESWSRLPFEKPRPLFQIEMAKPGQQVIIAEGEKCAAIGTAVTGRLFISWAGGTGGVDHADWSGLAGRSVVIWPDADGPGRATAQRIAVILAALGCTVKILDVDDKSDGWDVADAADDGWSHEQIVGFMRERARVWSPPEPPPEPPAPKPEPPADTGPEFAPISESDLRDWGHEYYENPGEMQMEVATDVIEYSHDKRRVIPTSGRSMMGGQWRAVGGDADQLREWAFLSRDKEFCHVHTGERMDIKAFDLVHEAITPLIDKIETNGDIKTKPIASSRFLMSYGDGLRCSTTMYRPDLPDMVAWVDGVLHLNSYLPSSVPDADPNWKDHQAWQVAEAHIRNVLPDGADTLIHWMAHNVQHPGKKIMWAPIILGQQGDGKTTIATILQMAMGRRNVQPVGEEELFSNFNSWAEGVCVRVLEELHQNGQNRSSVVDKLKAPITNSIVPIVGKNEKGKSVANVTNYFGITNYGDAVRIPDGDRRFWVMKTRFRDRDQVEAELTKQYWRALHAAIGKYPEVLRGWLLSIDLAEFDCHDAPEMTDAKAVMIAAGHSQVESDAREAIELGGQWIGQDVLETRALNAALKDISGKGMNTSGMNKVLSALGWTKHERILKYSGKPLRLYYRAGPWSEGLDRDELHRLLREKLQDTELPMHDDQVAIADWG